MAGRRGGSVSSAEASLLAAGTGGVEELCEHLADDTVAWALLRWEVGSGTFVRSKLVAIHFNGEEVPAVRRGRLNARSGEVLAMLGKAHATLEVKRKEDLHLDFMCERLMKVLTADVMEKSMSAEALRKDYEALIAERKLRKATSQKSVGPRTAKENQKQISVDRALAAVGDATGPYNWVLLEPEKFELHNAGYGGLLEMKVWLAEDLVLFGVIRFTFGRETASSVEGMTASPKVVKCARRNMFGRRGKWNAKQQQADAQVRAICSITFRREAHSLDDLDLADLISELWRLAVVDGAITDAGKSQISVEEYMASLALEQQKQLEAELEEFGSDSASRMCTDLHTCVDSVREAGGEMNWVLLGMQKREAPAQAAGAKEAAANAKKAEEERLAKEAAANAKKAEEERRVKETAANAKKAEEERLAKEAAANAKKAEEERLAKEAAANTKKAEEERLVTKAAAEAKKAEEERLAKEAAANAKKAEEERLATEAAAEAKKVEDERCAREAAANTKKVEEERLAKEAAAEAKKVEEEGRAKEAAANTKKAEEERLAKEACPVVVTDLQLQSACEMDKVVQGEPASSRPRADSPFLTEEARPSESVISTRSSRPGQASTEPRMSGPLKLKSGWGWWWAKRHVKLTGGKLQWWRKAAEGLPDVEYRLSDGLTRWVLARHEGTDLEMRCESRDNHHGSKAVGERVILRAPSEAEAQKWKDALMEQMEYVEMLLAWPMHLDGRQGDIRNYGIEYP
ncbi:unnamed protein product [Durusdinium trenchii]|uniref:PH domain-containing protein n=1 Tax=Durusdinium trenchii TaxID=1381693 RepID=A0ABP0L7B2_9DINO